MPSKGTQKKIITMNNINPNIWEMKSDMPSALVRRAQEIERELEKGVSKPFTEVIRADNNDVQAMGQKPLTFIREVLTACAYPNLFDDDALLPDVKKRANKILDDCGGRSIGSYTYSEGIDLVRDHVAQYIANRDGFNANANDVILSSGASEALRSILNILNCPTNGKKIGVLMPVPRDPLHSAPLVELGITQINYHLEEECNWGICTNEISTVLEAAKKHCVPKAIFVANPNNPTGSIFTRKSMEDVIAFAVQEKLVLLADEAYQFNIYEDGKFHSFKKIMMEMGPPYCEMELISFMSGSKGILAECGLRTGYCELVNIHPEVFKVYKKSICVKMCPSVLGQVALDCIVCPPSPGQSSYFLFQQEKVNMLQSLKERAVYLYSALNSLEGIKCSRIKGAIYAFPKLFLPKKMIKKAQSLGLAPDVFYALQLLENTGICTLPGTEFGQLPGTYHLRISISPEMTQLKKMLGYWKAFHCKILEEYK